ncbi:MAG: DUF4012 domain-containing protein [Candidatus Nanopelagicales bacterium]
MRHARKIGGLLLLIPVQLTLFAFWAACWSGIGGAVNLAWFAFQDSPIALARGAAWTGRAASLAGLPLRAWGALPFPGHERVRSAGGQLSWAGGLATAAAPILPTALGYYGPQHYLLAALNDAELFGSGGAPLELALVEVSRARPSVLVSGSAEGAFNPGNAPYLWPRVGGLPWYRTNGKYPFANSNFHPDFSFSGRNMASAWETLGQPRVDGVVTVDMTAVADVLAVTGPVTSGAYGELTADNLLSKVLVEAYRLYPGEANETRRIMNGQLRADLSDHVRAASPLKVLRALIKTVPARHIQLWAADPVAQAVVEKSGGAGLLTTRPGDILGVFSQSGPSKLAIFQNRTIKRRVVIAADGSAQVTQSVDFESDVPVGLEGDPESIAGYTALLFRQRVAFRVPATATKARVSADQGIVAAGKTGPFDDGVGAQVLWQGQDIKPRARATTQVSYSLPAGTFGSAGALTYQVTANPQAMARPVTMELEVEFPQSAGGGAGWVSAGKSAKWSGTLNRPLELRVAGR